MTNLKRIALCLSCLALQGAPAIAKTAKVKCVDALRELSAEMEKSARPELVAESQKFKVKNLDEEGEQIAIEKEGETEIYTLSTKFKIKKRPMERCDEEGEGAQTSTSKLMAIYDDAIKPKDKDTRPVKEKREKVKSECPPEITRRRAGTKPEGETGSVGVKQ